VIEILTPDEVSELLRISPNRVVLLARRGEIPFLTIDGRLRFDARDVEDWIQAHRSDAPITPPKVVSTTGLGVNGIAASKGKKLEGGARKYLHSEAGTVLGLRGAPKKDPNRI
jgi:excisionase family DNA binding protein